MPDTGRWLLRLGGLLLLLGGCREDAARHPFDPDSPTAMTAEARIAVRVQLPADDGIGDLRTFEQRQRALGGVRVHLFGTDGDGDPVEQLVNATARGDEAYAEFAVRRGDYRLEITHQSGGLDAQSVPEQAVKIGRNWTVVRRLERRPLKVVGRIGAPQAFAPDSVEVEIRWAAGEADADCRAGGTLGKPTVNIEAGAFGFEALMPLSPRVCAFARANELRSTMNTRPLPPERGALLDLGILDFVAETVELRALGRSAVADEGRADPGVAPDSVVDGRLVLLEISLAPPADGEVSSALAFPVNGQVPEGRVPVAEISVVDTSETGDQVGTPVRSGLDALPRGVQLCDGAGGHGSDRYLGAVSPVRCRERYDPAAQKMLAALADGALCDRLGVSSDHLLLPYCLTSADVGRKEVDVVLSAAGRTYSAAHALVLDQTPIEPLVVEVADSHLHAGRLYIDGRAETWRVGVSVPVEELRPWRVHVAARPLADGPCPSIESIDPGDFQETRPRATKQLDVAVSGGAPPLDRCYAATPYLLCAYVQDAAGNGTARAMDMVRVFGQSGGYVTPAGEPQRDPPADTEADGGLDGGADAAADAELDAAVGAEPDAASPAVDPGFADHPDLPPCAPALPILSGQRWVAEQCPIPQSAWDGIDGQPGGCEPPAPRRVGAEIVYKVHAWHSPNSALPAFKATYVEIDREPGALRAPVDRLLIAPLDGEDGPRRVRFIGIDMLDRSVPFMVLDRQGQPLPESLGDGVRFYRDVTAPDLQAADFNFCQRCNRVGGQGACVDCIDDIYQSGVNEVLAPSGAAVPFSLGFPAWSVQDDAPELCAMVRLDEAPDAPPLFMPVEESGIRIPSIGGGAFAGALTTRRFRVEVVDRRCNITRIPRPFTIVYDHLPPRPATGDEVGLPAMEVACTRPQETCEAAAEGSPSKWFGVEAPRAAQCGPGDGAPILRTLRFQMIDEGNRRIGDGIRYRVIATAGDDPPALVGSLCRNEPAWGQPRRRPCNPGAGCACLLEGVEAGPFPAPLELQADGEALPLVWAPNSCDPGVRLTAPLRLWVATEDSVGKRSVHPVRNKDCSDLDDACATRRYRLPVLGAFGEQAPYLTSHICLDDGDGLKPIGDPVDPPQGSPCAAP